MVSLDSHAAQPNSIDERDNRVTSASAEYMKIDTSVQLGFIPLKHC